jgi:hypothetical protein
MGRSGRAWVLLDRTENVARRQLTLGYRAAVVARMVFECQSVRILQECGRRHQANRSATGTSSSARKAAVLMLVAMADE